ncbi:MAG: hypothetical protein EAZ42_12155 [Verrucomicrobia bacterium]|nr:MAG: hypothetical protein EAZ42_12155 [Verrucomicrobiota bacterium]
MSESSSFRLSADFPHAALPEVFGVVTAADPLDLNGQSGLPGSILGDALRIKGWQHFPAQIDLPNSEEPRASFAVIVNLSELERLMRDFIRPGIFWVCRGQVFQTFFGHQEPKHLGSWDRFTNRPPTKLHASGNLSLLDQPATAFLCSTKCPGDKILEAYEWARHQCDTGGTVISGFHTPVEKDVLAILLRRGANILWVPARDLPKSVPKELKSTDDEGRFMILSPFTYGKIIRPSRESCSLRNRFILNYSSARYIPHIAKGSSLATDLEDHLI